MSGRRAVIRRIVWVIAGALVWALVGVAASALGSTASATPTVLPIPAHLTGDWTAPSGTFSAPATSVVVDSAVTVDLTAAAISGTTGYLFQLEPGGDLTVIGGQITGAMTGLVLDSVGNGGTASVLIRGTQLTNVRSIVFASVPSNPIDVTLNGVTATGLGDGLRATMDAVDVRYSTLQGGGVAPLGSPAGIHSLDDPNLDVAVPGSYINVFSTTITGFRSPKFQGDAIVGETRVATADIENCILGHNSDSGGIDSKIGSVIFKNNTVYSDGYRGVASHYGTLRSSGNTIYQSPGGGKKGSIGFAYQASGTLIATADTVVLSPGAYLAQTQIVLGPGAAAAWTYPRIGNITLNQIVDANGVSLVGPYKIAVSSGLRSTITINL